MGRGEIFDMHDLSGKTAQRSEEQVDLLNESKEHYSNDYESSRDGRESSWREIDEAVQHQKPRQSWTRTIFIFSLLACTVLVLLHEALSSGHGASNSITIPSTASLRPEEDYILSPTWDFNSPPTTREYTWIISDHTLNPDGVYRPMILINDTFPGPLIECNEGDELVIHIHNRATNATSIHWHGLYQNGTKARIFLPPIKKHKP
jgi:hypothetical protein